jgi:IgGFc binding protein
MSRFCVLLLLVAGILFFPRITGAQVLPRVGQNFSFGIIQGPDNLFADSAQSVTTLTLTVVSAYSGCGVITSPSGYTQDFTFIPGAATIIDLPYNLMLLNDLGKSNKGLLVHTTEPVNLVLHDYAPSAGDATQILPDNALDSSYVSFAWGIWDDPTDPTPERNNTEFLVTAASDSTLVTITPSVNTLNGLPDSVPFTILLNRGECYIVKADTSDHPSDPSLSGSKIQSTKPVSVIVGLTCGYVPIGAESCNELLDELIGKKWWGSHFFVQPLGDGDSGVEIVLTSDRNFYAKFDNGFSNSVHGRIAAEFSGTAEIHTFDLQNNPVPVEAHQLTRGSNYDFSGFGNFDGDPTLVTVLDTAYYSDTLVWNTPMLTSTFEGWVPIICPTADLARATIDGTPLSLTGVQSSVINGSSFSAINPAVSPGEHKIISPDPIFAIVAGFDIADAYSFVAGTDGSQMPHDTVTHLIVLKADSARTCNDFIVSATLATSVQDSEHLISLTIPITYDPTVLHFVALQPGAILTNGNYTVDSLTPGYVTVTIYGDPFIVGSDLFKLIFEGWRSVTATTVGNNASPSACGDDSGTLTIQPVTFAIAPSTDSLDRQFLLSSSGAAVCEPLTIAITLDSIVTQSDEFILSKIEVQFDTATEHFTGSKPGALLKNVFYTESGEAPGNYELLVPSPGILSGSDSLLLLHFDPLIMSANDTITVRIFYLRCGDTLSRDLTIIFPIGRNADTSHAVLTVTTASVTLGTMAVANVGLSGLPPAADVEQFDLYLTYDHDVLTYDHADLTGTLIVTWPLPKIDSGLTTDTLHFTSLAPLTAVSGILAHLWFKTFVADSSYSPIAVSISLFGTNANCPIVFGSPQASALFLGMDLCSDTLLRDALLGQPIAIDRAEIASDGNLHVVLQWLAANVSLSLTDILGRTLWNGELNCTAGINDRELALPQNLPTGPLLLRVMDGQHVRSRELMMVK